MSSINPSSKLPETSSVSTILDPHTLCFQSTLPCTLFHKSICPCSHKSETRVSPYSRSSPFPRVPFQFLLSPIRSFASVFHQLASIFHPPSCLHLHAFSQPHSTPQLQNVLPCIDFCHHQPYINLSCVCPKPAMSCIPLPSTLSCTHTSCSSTYQLYQRFSQKEENLDYSF